MKLQGLKKSKHNCKTGVEVTLFLCLVRNMISLENETLFKRSVLMIETSHLIKSSTTLDLFGMFNVLVAFL